MDKKTLCGGESLLRDWGKSQMSKKPRRTVPRYIENHVYRRDEGACRYCDRDPETHPHLIFHIHHIDVWSKVEEHNPKRMVVACSECNLSIRTKVVEPLYPSRSERRSSVAPVGGGKVRGDLALASAFAWEEHPDFVWFCRCPGRTNSYQRLACSICDEERPPLCEKNLGSGKIKRSP